MKFTSLRTSGIAAVVGVALASSLLLGASTVANAQAMSLTQLVNLFIQLGIISPDKAQAALAAVNTPTTSTTGTTSGYTYTRSLTVGSTGADVTALQNAVGISPATGYFGPLTQAAVAKWQASAGLPATGYFGPLSMAKLNASGSMTTTTTTTTTTGTTAVAGCTPGAMFSSTTGASCASTTSSTVATNTGVEGILTTNLNAVPSSGQNVYAGDTMDSLLGIKLQAQLSPITIQRVQVNLGTNTQFYTKAFSTLYLVSDTGQVLAQAALNSNTVTKQTSGSTNTYYLTFSGFNYTIPGDNSIHVLTVKGDLYSSIDLTELSNNGVLTIGIDQNGVRGVDGAGIDQYGPTGTNSANGTTDVLSNSFTVNRSLSTSAQLQVSTDPSNPLSTLVVANTGGNLNEADGVTTLIFDLFAQKDNISLQNLAGTTTITSGGSTAHALPTTAYLYDGTNLIGSAPITFTGLNGTFSFNNLSEVVNANSTKALTVKEDIKNADTTAIGQTTTVSYTGINAQNSVGDTITGTNLSGTAGGNQITVLQKGPVFTLNSITYDPTSKTTDNAGNATTTLTAHFSLGITAVGSDITFGNSASTTALIGTSTVDVYKSDTFLGVANSSAVNALVSNVSANYANVAVSVPSNGITVTPSSDGFVLAQNNSVTIPVTVTLTVNSKNPGLYALAVHQLNWGAGDNVTASNSSTFMTGLTSWRGGDVQLP